MIETHLIILLQRLEILSRQPEQLQHLLAHLPRRNAIHPAEVLPRQMLAVSNGDSSRKLPPLPLVDDLDEAGEDVRLPCDEHVAGQGMHALLKLDQVQAEAEGPSADLEHFVLQVLVAGVEGVEAGAVGL